MNSQFILDQAARFARRLQTEAGDDRANQVTRGWQLAFSRNPSDSELADALAFLSAQADYLQATAAAEKKEADDKPKKDEKKKPAPKIEPELQALTNLCQALLSANEFLYVD